MLCEWQLKRLRKKGYALMMVLGFLVIMVAVLGSVIQLASTGSALTARNNLYNSAVCAAEAATEKVLARMDYDFVNQSLSSTPSTYSSLVPSQTAWPVQFQFSDGSGVVDETGVQILGIQMQTNLDSQFAALYGLVNAYQVTSTARPVNQSYDPAATVSQQFQFALIPVFQFAIFYNLDMEINPGPAMVVTGKVHGNQDIYAAPVSSLEFKDSVTAVGQIYNNRDLYDPTGGSKTQPIYDKEHVEKVGSLTLPIGANDNSPGNVVQILDPRPQVNRLNRL